MIQRSYREIGLLHVSIDAVNRNQKLDRLFGRNHILSLELLEIFALCNLVCPSSEAICSPAAVHTVAIASLPEAITRVPSALKWTWWRFRLVWARL